MVPTPTRPHQIPKTIPLVPVYAARLSSDTLEKSKAPSIPNIAPLSARLAAVPSAEPGSLSTAATPLPTRSSTSASALRKPVI